MNWNSITEHSITILLAATGGGLFAAGAVVWTWWIDRREKNAQALLAQAMEIQALKEAWILEGTEYHRQRLSDHKGLATEDPKSGELWLRQVEVRTVLDEVQWNAQKNGYYGFIKGRRAWIVRDVLDRGLAYPKMVAGEITYHLALISSKGIEELCAWIERVASSEASWISGGLSRGGIAMLDVLLLAVAAEDRIKVFGDRLSMRARKFLQQYGGKSLGKALGN